MGAKNSRPTCPLIRWCSTRRNGSRGKRVGGSAGRRIGGSATAERENENENEND